MHADRLLRLADYLEKLPAERGQLPQCGTTADLAITLPEFQQDTPTFPENSKLAAVERFFGIGDPESRMLFLASSYHDSAAPFNPTPQEAAAKIRRFVAKKQKGEAHAS